MSRASSYFYRFRFDCPICLDTEDLEDYCVVRSCGHFYHTECFTRLVQQARDRGKTLKCAVCTNRICSRTSTREIEELIVPLKYWAESEREVQRIGPSSSQGEDLMGGESMMVNVGDDDSDDEEPYDEPKEAAAGLSDREREMQRTIHTLRAELGAAERERDAAKAMAGTDVVELTERVEHLEQELREVKDAKDELAMEKEGLAVDHSMMTRTLEDTLEEKQEELTRRINELHRVREHNDTIARDKRELERQKASLRDTIKKHETQAADLKARHEQLEEALKGKLQRLQTKLVDAETKHMTDEAELQNKLAEAQRQLAGKEEVIERIKKQRDTLREEKAELEHERATRTNDHDFLPTPADSQITADTIDQVPTYTDDDDIPILPPSRSLWKGRGEQKSERELQAEAIMKDLALNKTGANLAHGERSKAKKRKVK